MSSTGIALSKQCDALAVSYGGEECQVALYDRTKRDALSHTYRGHINEDTVKGVWFGGVHDELILSGSDCGNAFVWDRKTETLAALFPGDSRLANCIIMPPTGEVEFVSSGLSRVISVSLPVGDLTRLPDTRNYIKYNLEVQRRDLNQNIRQQIGQ